MYNSNVYMYEECIIAHIYIYILICVCMYVCACVCVLVCMHVCEREEVCLTDLNDIK
jgi:hypothetical protein